MYLNEGTDGSSFNEITDYDGFCSTYQILDGDSAGSHVVDAGGRYRIKTAAENSIGFSLDSEELIVALAAKSNTPDAPTFNTQESNRFQNVAEWTQGTS